MNWTSTISALVFAVGAAASVTHCGGGAQVRSVAATSITDLPAGQTYDIDLTRGGTIYMFEDPATTDLSRVMVRTSQGLRPFADVLKASNTDLRGGLLLGRPGDMRDHLPTGSGSGTGTSNYDCGVFCKCDNPGDCGALIVSGKCSDDYWCSSTTSSCFCTAKG